MPCSRPPAPSPALLPFPLLDVGPSPSRPLALLPSIRNVNRFSRSALAMANRMRAAAAAVRVLEERGVRFAFGVPGESFLGLLDALRDSRSIRLISARHEGGAAFMAEAVGKLT